MWVWSSRRHTTTTMAMLNAGRIFSVGNFVQCEGWLCYIQEFRNHIGFNQYYIIDCDSGVVLKHSWYQLEYVEVQDLVASDDKAFVYMADADTVGTKMKKMA